MAIFLQFENFENLDVLHVILWQVADINFPEGSGGHLGFMQITRVAQSCHLGNKAEFVL